jgi:hypothetical protein
LNPSSALRAFIYFSKYPIPSEFCVRLFYVAAFVAQSILQEKADSKRRARCYVGFGGCGCKEAGPRVAAIVSIMEACRRLGIPVRHYLGSVLAGLANFSINRIAELTPIAWKARSS